MEYVKINLSNPEEKQAYIDYINSVTGKWEIVHYPVTPKRSIPQNKLYRIYLTLISQETGYSEGYIHRQMRDLYALVVKANPFARKTTSDMTSVEFRMYCDLVLQHYFDFLGIDSDEEREP